METKIKNKPNLLIYAHYYYPDVASTGQILKELAEGMLDVFNITVICTVPSYIGDIHKEYQNKKYFYENINGVDIIRVSIPKFDKTKKFSRIKNILAYFLRAMRATFKVKQVDYVYSISQPPILGGLLGVWGKWIKRANFIYNIQDFNPEQVIATGYSKNPLIIKLMMMLDKFSCMQANKVIMVDRDMVRTLRRRFMNKYGKIVNLPKYTYINNWIDEKEIYPLSHEDANVSAFRKKHGLEDKFVFMYSGNLGIFYDLENIIRVLKKFRKGKTLDGKYESGPKTKDGKEVVFVFVGAGSIQHRLVEYSKKHHIDNIVFIPYQRKEELNYSLNAADVHLCVSAKGVKGVSCPSKFYGITAVAKPVLGVMEDGAGCRLILEKTKCGLACEPEAYNQIEEHIRWFIDNSDSKELFDMGKRGRKYLEKNLSKDVAISKYIKEIFGEYEAEKKEADLKLTKEMLLRKGQYW